MGISFRLGLATGSGSSPRSHVIEDPDKGGPAILHPGEKALLFLPEPGHFSCLSRRCRCKPLVDERLMTITPRIVFGNLAFCDLFKQRAGRLRGPGPGNWSLLPSGGYLCRFDIFPAKGASLFEAVEKTHPSQEQLFPCEGRRGVKFVVQLVGGENLHFPSLLQDENGALPIRHVDATRGPHRR